MKECSGDKLNLAKQRLLSLIEKKILWEKEKILATNIFFFVHIAFKRPLL